MPGASAGTGSGHGRKQGCNGRGTEGPGRGQPQGRPETSASAGDGGTPCRDHGDFSWMRNFVGGAYSPWARARSSDETRG